MEKIKRPNRTRDETHLMNEKNFQEYVNAQFKKIFNKLDEIVERINDKKEI